MVRARLDKSPRDVAAMFDQVAKRYDVLNDLLSLGRTKAWRRAVVATIGPREGMRILDCAAGTGSSTAPLVAAGADAIASDFSLGMLEAGAARLQALTFIAADNLALPFQDGAFDCVTISFGLRNVADTHKALAEAHRELRHAGRRRDAARAGGRGHGAAGWMAGPLVRRSLEAAICSARGAGGSFGSAKWPPGARAWRRSSICFCSK